MPQVFGRYLLLQRLSSGGMGEIFLAKHGLVGFEKICVIKKVLPHLSQDEHFLSRFIDEAQVAIQLQHANVAQVFEVGRVDDDYFLALEFVEGCDVRRALARLIERGQRFPVELGLMIARDVATGLSYAHRRKDAAGRALGLVHCDISPPNIMISFEGEVKVIDFGIAKSALAGTATDPKMGFGKLGYMAPEQLVRGGRIDARTDIYATGAVLFELLTGHRLYEHEPGGDHRALARLIIRGQHPLPSAVDPALAPYDTLVARALHPDPEQRFQSATALRDALQEVLVRIHPTLSSEHLGMFARDLFAGEVAALRQLAARAQGADLGPWQAQLAQRSNATISIALSPLHTREMQVPAVPGAGAGPSATPGRPTATQRMPRRSVALWAVLSTLFFVGSAALAMAVVTLVAEPEPEVVPAVSIAPGPAPVPAAVTPDAAAAEIADTVPPGPEVGDVGDTASGDAGQADEIETSPREPRRPRPRKKPPAPAPEQPEQVSADQVQAKFSAVSREYRQFKQSYGPRFDDAWADLAQRAQYAGSDPAKLRALSQELDGFRARMRAARDD
jgi:serine/threonine protein kinase